MSEWPSTKARLVYKALLKIAGLFFVKWVPIGNSNTLISRNYTWSFGDSDELGPTMVARIAKKTGLKPSDL